MDYFKYDDLAELLRDAKKPCRVASNEAVRSISGPRGWYCQDRREIDSQEKGIAAFDCAAFPAGVERLERLAAQIEAPSPISIKRKLTRGDHGDELDQGKVWNGELDTAWTRAARQATPAVSRVCIGVMVAASAGTDSNAMAWRGVAALALAEALEAAGYTVEVRAMSSVWHYKKSGRDESDKNRHDIDVIVKPVGQPLDVHRAASLIASPLLFRAVLISHSVAHAKEALNYGASFTRPDHTTMTDTQGFDFACIVPSTCSTESAARAWLQRTVQELETKQRGE